MVTILFSRYQQTLCSHDAQGSGIETFVQGKLHCDDDRTCRMLRVTNCMICNAIVPTSVRKIHDDPPLRSSTNTRTRPERPTFSSKEARLERERGRISVIHEESARRREGRRVFTKTRFCSARRARAKRLESLWTTVGMGQIRF